MRMRALRSCCRRVYDSHHGRVGAGSDKASEASDLSPNPEVRSIDIGDARRVAPPLRLVIAGVG